MSSFPIRNPSTGENTGETAPMMRAILRYNKENPGKITEEELNMCRDVLNFRKYPHYMSLNQYVNPNEIHKHIGFPRV